MKNLPEKIYLQIEDDGVIGNELDLSCITWSVDRVYESDIEYVLNEKSNNNENKQETQGTDKTEI